MFHFFLILLFIICEVPKCIPKNGQLESVQPLIGYDRLIMMLVNQHHNVRTITFKTLCTCISFSLYNLYVSLSISLSPSLSLTLFLYLFLCLSISLPQSLSFLYLSLSTCLSLPLSLSLSISTFFTISLSLSLTLSLSLFLSLPLSLSVCPCLYLSFYLSVFYLSLFSVFFTIYTAVKNVVSCFSFLLLLNSFFNSHSILKYFHV